MFYHGSVNTFNTDFWSNFHVQQLHFFKIPKKIITKNEDFNVNISLLEKQTKLKVITRILQPASTIKSSLDDFYVYAFPFSSRLYCVVPFCTFNQEFRWPQIHFQRNPFYYLTTYSSKNMNSSS